MVQTQVKNELAPTGVPMRRFRTKDRKDIKARGISYSNVSIPIKGAEDGMNWEIQLTGRHFSDKTLPDYASFEFAENAIIPTDIPEVGGMLVYEFLKQHPLTKTGEIYEDTNYYIQSANQAKVIQNIQLDEELEKKEEKAQAVNAYVQDMQIQAEKQKNLLLQLSAEVEAKKKELNTSVNEGLKGLESQEDKE